MLNDTKIDVELSGEIDEPIKSGTTSPSMSLPTPLSISQPVVKEWFGKKKANLRPFGTFFNTTNFQVPPSAGRLTKRLYKNIEYFQSNYVLVFVVLVVYCLISSPLLLIVIAAAGGASYIASMKNSERKLAIAGHEVSLAQQYGVISVCSIPFFLWAGAGGIVFWVLGASMFFITAHAAFYNYDALEVAVTIEAKSGGETNVDMNEMEKMKKELEAARAEIKADTEKFATMKAEAERLAAEKIEREKKIEDQTKESKMTAQKELKTTQKKAGKGEEDKVSFPIGQLKGEAVRVDLYKTVGNILNCTVFPNADTSPESSLPTISHIIKSRPSKSPKLKIVTKSKKNKKMIEFDLEAFQEDQKLDNEVLLEATEKEETDNNEVTKYETERHPKEEQKSSADKIDTGSVANKTDTDILPEEVTATGQDKKNESDNTEGDGNVAEKTEKEKNVLVMRDGEGLAVENTDDIEARSGGETNVEMNEMEKMKKELEAARAEIKAEAEKFAAMKAESERLAAEKVGAEELARENDKLKRELETEKTEKMEREKKIEDQTKESKMTAQKELKTTQKKAGNFVSFVTGIASSNKNKYVVDAEDYNRELKDLVDAAYQDCKKLEDIYNDASHAIESGISTDVSASLTSFTKTVDIVCNQQDFQDKVTNLRDRYKATDMAKLARRMINEKDFTGTANGLNKYKLPVRLAYNNPTKKIRRFVLGEEDFAKERKTIMMVGMTGAGKSLMINNLINYAYGVEYKDKFRFELVVDKEEQADRQGEGISNQAGQSMTSWVTAFDLNYQKGSRTGFNLTLIDTPGFADSQGISYDEKIIDRIRNFFHDDKACPSQEITTIGFVIQASSARLTDEQRYIYDSVLNLFGKDMTKNVSLLFTFADAQPPPALKSVEAHKIPFNQHFKFNNSAVYAPNGGDEEKFAWDFGYRNVSTLVQHLGSTISMSLTQTKEVLQERDHLKCILGGLKEKMDKGMSQLMSIESMIDDISALKGTARANERYKVKKTIQEQTTLVVDHDITNCVSCGFTCHDPCYIAGDKKEGCASMKGGMCLICPGKCPWGSHKNGDRIYVYTPVEQEETIGDMLDKYNIAIHDKNAKKKLLQELLDEYKAYKNNLFENIDNAAKATTRLEEIAIKNTYLTNVTYIERLIESERRGNRDNKAKRVEQLETALDMARILDTAKNNPLSLTQHMSEYEMKVVDRIKDMEEEEIDIQPSKIDVQSSKTNWWNWR